ncbi:MAG: tetraacyldisaccharide 4'-kinase [Chitinivibrionia bacterium]|nr:tetraacyldisaccharide 4'-kinase [Chitinivibrionia bacterium]
MRFLSFIYLFVINLRNRYYDKFLPKKLDFPVISVGGIRAGGSGKTPIADWIIAQIEEAGKTPVLFSRGYKRLSKQTEIVSPNNETCWQAVGDEPLMLKKHRKKLWLAIDANRKRAEKKLRAFGLKNIVGVMDDGFQRRDFWRDLDVVILAPNDLTDNILPLGMLREPVKSLERADIILSQKKIKYGNNCIVEFVADEFINAVSGEKKLNFDDEILCFCGIARPQRFLDSVNKLTKKENKYLFFPDHHKYCDKDYETLNSACQAVLVTTEKDFMRLDAKRIAKMQNLWYISYSARLENESYGFMKNKILEICGEKK